MSQSRQLTAALFLLGLVPGVGTAQTAPASPRHWHLQAETGASVFFGNTRQTLVTNRTGLQHADSAFESRLDGAVTYAEAVTTTGATEVSRRSWILGSTLDYRPYAVVSPFLLASVESSLEKRIRRRMLGGAGAKYAIIREGSTRLDLSLALLADRTVVPDSALGSTGTTVARWSSRLRARRAFSKAVTMSMETFYRPRVDKLDRYTLTNVTRFAYQLTRAISLSASFGDSYDSEAMRRGARTNNDGEMVFGLIAGF